MKPQNYPGKATTRRQSDGFGLWFSQIRNGDKRFKRRMCKRYSFRKITVSVCLLVIVCSFYFYTVKSSGIYLTELELHPCKITKLNPWDAALTPFLVKPPPLECNDKHDFVYIDEHGMLNYNLSVAAFYGIQVKDLRCTYQCIERLKGDLELAFGDKIEISKTPMLIKCHIFRVTCKNATDTMYDMAHFNVHWNEYGKSIQDMEEETPERPSILMLGLDSVSRSHAVRNLQKSYKYLEQEFQTFDFIGYSKVGENTFPNLVPLLTGQSHRDFRMVEHIHIHTDTMPLLWNEKPVKRMASYFAEDRPDISTFNYMKGGFKEIPTDFYFRPYTLAMGKFEPVLVNPLGPPTWNCYGKRNYFDLEIGYTKGFLKHYGTKRKFTYFWSNQVAHEDFTTLRRGDGSFLELLQWLKENKVTNNTILFILSDHGFRIGGASLTHVGRAENNKPWLLIHVPKHILVKHPHIKAALETNTNRLVTHYDVYQTVLDLLYNRAFGKIPQEPVKKSLVRRNVFSVVPKGRTCVDAGIEDKYCTCREKTMLPSNTDLTFHMVGKLVSSINKILSNYTKQCQKVVLHNITEASVIYSVSDESNLPSNQKNVKLSFIDKLFGKYNYKADTMTGRYTLLFYTSPGNAYYEGTLDFSQFGAGALTDKMTVVGEPSRLNRYGTQSHCVKDSFIKLYCYCKQQL